MHLAYLQKLIKQPLPERSMEGASGQGCDKQGCGSSEPRQWVEERLDSTPRCLGKERPFSIPLDTGSHAGGDAPQRGRQRTERSEVCSRGRGGVCVCVGGNWLVAMPLGTSMLNRGLTDKTLEPVPPHSSVPLKHHLLSLGQFSHLYIEIRAPMHDKIVALCRRRWVFGM